MRIAVTLPTYNEVDNLRNVVTKIMALPYDAQIVIVDDNSPDGTGALADELAEEFDGRIHVIHRTNERGRGSAGIAAFKRSLELDIDCIIEMDADLSHDPDEIPRLVEASADYDLIVGSRYIPDGLEVNRSPSRTLISWLANNYLRLVLGLRLRDCSSGFKCYKKASLKALDLDTLQSNGPSIGPEMLWKCKKRGYRIKEVPITFRDREAGESKLMSTNILIDSLLFPLSLRWRQLFASSS
jgi:dolichol-phosphate mannosyltransferase